MRFGFRLFRISTILAIATGLFNVSNDSAVPVKDSFNEGSKSTYSYIDSLVTNTPLREKIGQLFVVPAQGRFFNKDDHRYKELVDLVTRHHVGGIIFMNGDVYGQAMVTNKLQQMADIPLWITQDMEFGAAMRVAGTTRFTPAMGVASTGNVQNAYLVGKYTAKEAKALGVHQIFAPVLDVNNNPNNPVINIRSFSEDPEMVAAFGKAYIEGVQSEGLVATAKHFPGHGDTDEDSHLGLPVVEHDYARLDSVELIPFRAAIDGGITSIMSAHIAFPGISDENKLPATLDGSILGDLLLDSLGFDGLVITDGLEMRGITSKFSPGRAVVKALNAGADIMLISPDIYTAIEEVMAAVKYGEITEERINTSFRKFLLWKSEFGLFNSDNLVDIEKLDERIASHENEAVARKIARESITILENKGNVLPIDPNKYKSILVVAVSDDATGRTGRTFAGDLRDFHPNVRFYAHDERTSSNDEQRILRRARQSDLIVIGSFINFKTGSEIQYDKRQINFLKKLLGTGKTSVHVTFGNPYVLKEFPKINVQGIGWANNSNQTSAMAHALFGAHDITGKLTTNIPGYHAIGDGIEMKASIMGFGDPEDAGLSSVKLFRIEDILRDAVNDSVFPGAVVGVLKDGKLVYHEAVGYHDYSKIKKSETSDVFDLASLTKVLSTTTAIMKLVDDGTVSLADNVWRFIPQYNTDEKRDITIRDLLLHQSGLPPFRVYVDSLKTRSEILNAVKSEPLTYETGTEYIYSDLGMILLAEIVQVVTKQRVDRYVRNKFHYPMGMTSTYFNPRKLSRWYVRRIPPTEIDNLYNRGTVRANVHDERAYFMDGIAGHAGLFSSVSDIAKYCTMILNEGNYGGVQYLKPETVRLFTESQSEISNRGYGWDRRSRDGFTSAGQLSSPDTFGHTGFTGTSFWIDRDRNMAIILLTNRVHPNRRYGRTISRVRAAVADAAFSSIIDP